MVEVLANHLWCIIIILFLVIGLVFAFIKNHNYKKQIHQVGRLLVFTDEDGAYFYADLDESPASLNDGDIAFFLVERKREKHV